MLRQVEFADTTTGADHLGINSRPLRRVGQVVQGSMSGCLLWAEGSESRTVERSPCGSKAKDTSQALASSVITGRAWAAAD